jgi:hypothetical protein
LIQDRAAPDRLLIRLYGDSLSMPREAEGIRYFDCFGELLAASLRKALSGTEVSLYNRSYSGPRITDIYETCRADTFFFGSDGNDIAILQCGIVDCAPRPVPPKIRSIVARLPGALRNLIVSFIHRNRASMLRSGLIWRVTPPQAFTVSMIETLKLMLPSFSRVYVINIAPTTAGTEAHSPGLSESIDQYNRLIKDSIAAVGSPNIRLIDVHSAILSQAQPIEQYVSQVDGHHITVRAHQLYAGLILEQEAQLQRSSG